MSRLDFKKDPFKAKWVQDVICYGGWAALIFAVIFLGMVMFYLFFEQAAEPDPQTEILTVEAEAVVAEPEEETLEPESTVMLNNLNCADLSAKTYMDISMITNSASDQWQYLVTLDCVLVDDKGNLRVCNDTGYILTEDGFYGVAMGSYFGVVGDKFIVTLDTGTVIKVVKVEEKADAHTDSTNISGAASGDVIEFVIDSSTAYMQSRWSFTRYDGTECASNGLVYNGNFNNCAEFYGNVMTVEKVVNE